MQPQQLSSKERHMVRLYIAGCFHKWEQLPGGRCSSFPRHTGLDVLLRLSFALRQMPPFLAA